ncbi:MAG: hypothetical protein LBG92_08455, partial [Prevotellaceae bacterium]|nr:hypothetical protein [Prevotellaceae bacterium]
MKKYGLDVYGSSDKSLKGQDYAEVIDESMMIGSEKLLLTLAVPSAHQGRPLCHSDVSVLDMSVSNSWTGESVKTQLDKTAEKVGHKPEYVISDNAFTMAKGIRLSGIAHHCDISHSLGMYLERTYKEADDFNAYVKQMADVKFKHNMKKIACLLPTQRTIARFINLSGWVKWSCKMLDVYHTLSSEEQSIFSFIPANASFINELSDVIDCVESIESVCKRQGFSRETSRQCQLQINKKLFSGNSRMMQLGWDIYNFLDTESSMLKSDNDVH